MEEGWLKNTQHMVLIVPSDPCEAEQRRSELTKGRRKRRVRTLGTDMVVVSLFIDSIRAAAHLGI